MNQAVTPIIAPLPAKAVAARNFRDGEGLESNPYPKGSADYDAFMWEMHRLQFSEFDAEQQPYYRG